MKIIAQKSDILNSYDFFNQFLTYDYINGISLNVAITSDNQLVIYNTPILSGAVTNTIESSTLEQLETYEIIKLDDTLESLNNTKTTKNIYLNIIPFKTGVTTDENIEIITNRINLYIDKIINLINKYPNLNINLHSISRNFISILQNKIKNHKIGFVIYGDELSFIDVDYYIITTNVFNDNIINMLINRGKDVLLYLYSDYYIYYIYNHYFGEKSTPEMQKIFDKLGIISTYPDIINKVFPQ